MPGALTRGQRIGGGLLLANAALVLIEAVILPASTKPDAFGSPSRSIAPALFDIVIGGMLLTGNGKLLRLAIVRVVLGLVIFTVFYAVTDPLMAVSQVMVSSALLLLLLGDAKTPRIAVGSAIFAIYALLNVIGINATLSGRNPVATFIQSALGKVESIQGGIVTGDLSHYRLHAPSDRWVTRTKAEARKDNPLADRWLTRPDLDAHVVVIAEHVPAMLVMPDALADASMKNAKAAATSFTLVDRTPLKSNPEKGRLVHTKSVTSGVDIEGFTGIVAVYEYGYQIVAFAPKKTFAEVEGELRGIVESFELPKDIQPTLPADVDPTPIAGPIKGLLSPYTLVAPNAFWFLRKDAAAKTDNPLADRWLVRPDEDSHLFVVAEEVKGANIDADRYTDAVAELIKTKLSGTITSREPVKSDPKNGRILHVTATVNSLPLEYLYGCFGRGDIAFQVIGFAHQTVFPRMQPELEKAIESFQMPPEPAKTK